ncbi:cytochrome c-type biogenesis CcmF C-terminal domain-containing protein [Escherichia coli]
MLSLLGTLIVRSGILVSVHAFALDNVRAVPLFSLFALISLASLALYGWRARDGGPAVRFSGLSREMLILATLLLFRAVLLIVLVGTLYPMIYGLLGWGRLPLARRILTAAVTVCSVDAGGDCAGDVCLWQSAQLPALLAHAGVLLFAAGIWVSASAVRRSA